MLVFCTGSLGVRVSVRVTFRVKGECYFNQAKGQSDWVRVGVQVRVRVRFTVRVSVSKD